MPRQKDTAKALPAELVEALRQTVAKLVQEIRDGQTAFLMSMAEYLGDPDNAYGIAKRLEEVGLSRSDMILPVNFRLGGVSSESTNPISEATLQRFIDSRVKTTNIYVNSLYIYITL